MKFKIKMKNLKFKILFIAFLINASIYSQKITVDYIKYKKYTTAEKNAINVSDTSKSYIVFDSDLNSYQIYNGTSWVALKKDVLSFNGNEFHNPTFNFVEQDTKINLHNEINTSTYTIEESNFGVNQITVNVPIDARFQIKLPFNYKANQYYTLGFIYKQNSGTLKPNINTFILQTSNPNNTDLGTAREIDLGQGYTLYLHEGVRYNASVNEPDGIFIDISNVGGSDVINTSILSPIVLPTEKFDNNFNFSFGNVFNVFENKIDNLNLNYTTAQTDISANTKKIDETLEAELTDVLISNTNETSTTTTLMDLFNVEAGKTYKITAISNDAIGVNGLSYYNQLGNTVYHNHAQNEDFANGVTHQFTAELTETIRWRIWEIGLDVNFVISEVKYQSEKINTAVTNSAIVNDLVEEYNFVELTNLPITTTTIQESIAISEYQGKELEVYLKAPYTGDFTIYSRDNPYTTLTTVKSITNTDFTNGYTFKITIPNDADILNIRTYQLLTIDEFSIKDIKIKDKFLQSGNQWKGKVGAFYGNSITASSNGDYSMPYSDFTKWTITTSNDLQLAKSYTRGIGGQSYDYKTNGGSVSFITADGNLHSRNDSYNYDNYSGNVTVPAGTTPIRGAYSSWLRITTMFPASIKDEIDFVFIMGGTNDAEDNTEEVWVANDTTDAEWAASAQYSTHNGDFNINTLRGGLASTIMKFQVWMPNALIIVGTPLSGRGVDNSGTSYNYTVVTEEYNKANYITTTTGRLSIPTVDVYKESGINGWNRPIYMTDGVHPFNQAGANMLSRTVSGGIIRYYPINR